MLVLHWLDAGAAGLCAPRARQRWRRAHAGAIVALIMAASTDDTGRALSETGEALPSAARAAGVGAAAASAHVRPGTPAAGHLFAYGTLEVPAVLAKVIGSERAPEPALLLGFSRYLLASYPYPAVIADPSGSVAGSLFRDLGAEAFALLDAYEGDLYERRELSVRVGDAVLQAQSYVLRGEFHDLLSRAPWDRHEFERRHLESYLARL